ncbi:MAG TPA: hypothetical protein VMU04_12140 [Candidatus Acidoferrum sp.]|nr:hypothetical protein [Candidatus Acidoferrum sp.]
MSHSEESYRRICDQVWALYQAQLEKEGPRRSKRKVLLPPPPRPRRVDLLIVGISPSPVARIGYAAQRAGAERLARDFEYVTAAGNRGASFTNDSFYDPLLQFARRIDPRFGVWPQVERGEKPLLVEFTDSLHITTDHRIADDLLAVMNPEADNDPVCIQCKEILEAELTLYQPRVVVCSGRLPSKFLWEICAQRPLERPVTETLLRKTRFGAVVHFSGYLNSHWLDGFSRARLLREIKETTDFTQI